MGCSRSTMKSPESPETGDKELFRAEVSSNGEKREETPFEEEDKAETATNWASSVRDPKYIFQIHFKTKPLGIMLTSDQYGSGAFVTQVEPRKNKALKKNKLPINSKLLKLRDTEVEMQSIETIKDLIIKNMEKLPLDLTFCHPDGLREDEIPDSSPKSDFPIVAYQKKSP